MTKNKLISKISGAKILKWDKAIPKSGISLDKKSKAAVVSDQKGTPYLFVLDSHAFLDILSEIDEQLVDRLSDNDYYSKKINPAGWLIDSIESKLPVKKSYIQSLKKAVAEARQKGWIPFETIEKELNLA